MIRSQESQDAEIDSLKFNQDGPGQMQDRIRKIEKLLDVWNSPWWKLVLFVIDGWPLRRVADRPQWRPWRRWWTS